MSHRRWTQRILHLSLLASFALVACQAPTVGNLNIKVQLPAQSTTQALFQLQAIPENTDTLTLEITGSGLSEPYTESLSAGSETTQYTRQIELPIGPKIVRVTAFQDQETLASGESDIVIKAGQSERLTLTLEPVERDILEDELRIGVTGLIPVLIPMNLRISGEGLETPIQEELALPAGFNPSISLDTTALPPGEKTVEIRIQTTNGLGDKLPTIVENFTVNETNGAALELNIEALIQRYRAELAQIPELLELLRQQAPYLLRLIQENPEANPTPTPSEAPTPSSGSGQIRWGPIVPTPTSSPSP